MSEAMSAARLFFSDFDRRVANARIVNSLSHESKDAASVAELPRDITGEVSREAKGTL